MMRGTFTEKTRKKCLVIFMSGNNFDEMEYSYDASKLSEFDTCGLLIMASSAESWRNMITEGRKRRPQEKGRKKRKKGKPNAPELFIFGSCPKIRDCRSRYLQYKN